MLQLFPEGFAEEEGKGGVELVAFTDEAGVRRLRASFGEVTTVPVLPGWDEEWKRFHVPIVVGSLWIGPPWEQPPRERLPVFIDPGRAFGTGSHPTTRLCLELLHEVELGSVLDLGCGSGVLAIAAAKLGFEPVTAADNDVAASRRQEPTRSATRSSSKYGGSTPSSTLCPRCISSSRTSISARWTGLRRSSAADWR